jgi:hypothetical protein
MPTMTLDEFAEGEMKVLSNFISKIVNEKIRGDVKKSHGRG